MLKSKYRRAGAPVLLAFGTARDREGLRAGLLFVSAQLDPLDYVLLDSETGESITVRLPGTLIDQPADTMKVNVTLEVVT